MENDESKRINFPLALIRSLFKSDLGWFSLLIVGRFEKNQALHDLIVKSVVVYHKPKE